MGNSVLVFISHSSEDKESYIQPIANDLEDSYINVWIDKKNIIPGDNLRKSVFRDGLDKCDITLIFFTENSLNSSWVDCEIKHLLREEKKKGNNFDLNKIISIFDSEDTYNKISNRYPELTDDLLHLMPKNYDKIHLGKLISAIWSKYFSLQGDIEHQRQLLLKDQEIFKKDKDIDELKQKNTELNKKLIDTINNSDEQSKIKKFEEIYNSGKISELIENKEIILTHNLFKAEFIPKFADAYAFGILRFNNDTLFASISDLGKEFFEWYILNKQK